MTPTPDKPSAIAVIVPVRDGAAFLAEAIDSIIGQNGNFTKDVVVVDDGSTDESAAIAASRSGVLCIRQPPLGVADALNRGLDSTTAPLVAFLDADDIMPQGSLAARYAAITDDCSLEVVFGRMVQFMDPRTPPDVQKRLRADPRPASAQLCGTCLARRTVFDRIGKFDPAPEATTFLDWVLRIRHAGVASSEVDAVVLERRVHGANLSLDRTRVQAGYLTTLRRHFARQRAK
jgi:glycosyltransferase involved in cell wall biosynthesis